MATIIYVVPLCVLFLSIVFSIDGLNNTMDDNIKGVLENDNFKSIKKILHDMALKSETERQNSNALKNSIKEEGANKIDRELNDVNVHGTVHTGKPHHTDNIKKKNTSYNHSKSSKDVSDTISGKVLKSANDHWKPVLKKRGKIDVGEREVIAEHLDQHIHQILMVKNSTTPGKTNLKHKKVKENFRDLSEDAAMWVGVVIGATVTLVIMFIVALLCFVAKKLKSYSEKHLLKDLNVNSFCDYSKDPVYVRLSQLHDRRTSHPHVVTVLDQSNNFSIATSSESSTEEEIFNASDLLCPQENQPEPRRYPLNMTSTPVKSPMRVRLSSGGPTTPIKDKVASQYSSPVSPLTSVPPVFASPIKYYQQIISKPHRSP